MRHLLPTTIVTTLCLLLAQVASGQERVTLRYGQISNSARSISSLPLYVAQRMGFFEREGIDLKVVRLGGARHQVEELDHGTVDVSHTATPYLIQPVLDGSDAVAIVGGPANTIFSLIARPEIKRVAMSLPVDTISIASRMLLEKYGLKEPAYLTKVLEGTPARANCLITGECDAAPLGQPDDIVFAQKGFTKLGDSLEVIRVLQFNVIAARRGWAAANKDYVTRLARAFGNAYRFMRDQGNREEVANLVVETTGAPTDVARTILAFYYEPDRGVMPKQAEIDMAGMTQVLDLLGNTGGLKPPLPRAERFVDLQYLKAARLQ